MVKSYLSLLICIGMVAMSFSGFAADLFYVETSEGVLMGRYQAREAVGPSTQYESNISRASPSLGIGIRLTPWIALEEEYDDEGSYNFDNLYAYPQDSFTEFEHNRIDERLGAVTTRIAMTVPLPRRWDLILAPGVEYQFLRQTSDYLQWYTVPFSLSQVTPAQSTQTYRFWRPDFDMRLSQSLGKYCSLFAGYRFFESPGKELSRLSGGITVSW
jgi:hypothetical protein